MQKKVIGFCVSMFGLYLFYTGTIGPVVRGDGLNWQFALYGVVFGVPVLVLGSWISSLVEKSDQSLRNKVAQRTVGDLTSGASGTANDREFALYLRPFVIDGRFIAQRKSANVFDLDQYDRVGVDALERVIGDAIKKTYPTIAFGNSPLEVSGVGEVGFLENWKQKAGKLIEGASIIFVVPSMYPGTFWEVEEICRQNVLQKTIFIMPWRADTVLAGGKKSFADQWSEMRIVFEKEFGLKMPVYDSVGGFFRFPSSNRSPTFVVSDRGDSPRSVALSINKLL